MSSSPATSSPSITRSSSCSGGFTTDPLSARQPGEATSSALAHRADERVAHFGALGGR
jgi:hypothetical protein